MKDVDYKHPIFTDVPKGEVEGGNFYWNIKTPLSSIPEAYTSLGDEGEYAIYMIITTYVGDTYDTLIAGKNTIKIK